MFKLFFNRRSPVVLLWGTLSLYLLYLEVGDALSALRAPRPSWLLSGLMLLAAFLFGFTGFCRFFPWYKKPHRGHGIDDHFAKTFVAASYVYGVGGLVFYATHSAIPLLLTALLLALMVGTHFHVIRYYLEDKNPLPPGYYQRGLYRI